MLERLPVEHMKILIAEDEPDIAMQYELALKDRKHEVVVTHDGEQCLDAFYQELEKHEPAHNSKMKSPFDAVILDYRMPKKDGMEVAKEILAIEPKQRILFASAYVLETLVDSVKNLQQVVELIQKPFELDPFVDLIEDKGIYSELEKLNVNAKEIKDLNPTHQQVQDLLEGLKKLQKGRAL
jgi:two-component system, chemotaxis family, chemotaxis protein CheY